jgi:D-glycero-alpha-D-manno-heptose-7-phosphate kinase
VGVEQLSGRYSQSTLLQQSTIFELEKNSLLVYVGESHVSGNIHSDIRSAYDLTDSPTKRAMSELKRLADLGREALLRGDLYVFAQLLNENWRWHKELHPSCTNKTLEDVYTLALSNGAVGGATCGAGGGGCVVLICEDQKRHTLAKLLSARGYQLIDFVFNFNGVQVWEG